MRSGVSPHLLDFGPSSPRVDAAGDTTICYSDSARGVDWGKRYTEPLSAVGKNGLLQNICHPGGIKEPLEAIAEFAAAALGD